MLLIKGLTKERNDPIIHGACVVSVVGVGGNEDRKPPFRFRPMLSKKALMNGAFGRPWCFGSVQASFGWLGIPIFGR
jgi:hypothetical protein